MTVTLASGAPRLLSPLCAAAFVLMIAVAAPEAQVLQSTVASAHPASESPAAGAARSGAATEVSEVQLLVGRSTVLNVGTPITRVSLTSPTVADAMVTTPNQLLIHGKAPGTISMFVWDRSGGITRYEVVVQRDLSQLGDQLKALFPGEKIGVTSNGTDVVISGTVASKYVVEKAAEVAGGYVEKKEDVVNLLKQQEGVASNQVLLRVRFAEVSRSAMQELGATFFANGYKSEWFGRTAPDGVPAPDFDSDQGGLVFSDFLNLFVFNSKEGLGAAVRALSNKGLFQSLAEPNLVATNGKEASFLAGGEYPYPVVQSGSGNNAVTIMFKEFGVRLNFTPTVLEGDLVNLKVRPEVSSLDFANAVTVEGFRVPALTTRRTETEVELRDGQTFAIAGLMNNTLTSAMSKIPGIGDIPILGYLFRSKAHQKNQTELVVMITPTIIRRGQMGASEGLPSLVEPYLGKPDKSVPNPEPYTGSPRFPVTPTSSSAQPPAAAPAAARVSQPQRAEAVRPAPAQRQAASVETPAVAEAAVTTDRPAPQPAPVAQTSPKPTAAQQKAAAKAAEQERERAKKVAAEQAKLEAEREKVEAERQKQAREVAEAERRKNAKLEKELAKRQAEADRRNAELSKKKAQENGKALAEAAAKLKEAEVAYQRELSKSGSK
jgi:pilus assembly protein CpaC